MDRGQKPRPWLLGWTAWGIRWWRRLEGGGGWLWWRWFFRRRGWWWRWWGRVGELVTDGCSEIFYRRRKRPNRESRQRRRAANVGRNRAHDSWRERALCRGRDARGDCRTAWRE